MCRRPLNAAVRNDFVDVHVRLRARAGLPHIERKFAVELAGDHLIANSFKSSSPFHAGSRPAAVFTIAAAFLT